MIFSLFLVGFISMLGQVTILRELNVAFYGIELIYTMAIGVWLFWTAAGALLFRRTAPSDAKIALLFFALAVILPADVLFLRAGRLFFAGVPGAYLSFFRQMALLVISLLPVGLSLGLLFQWAARLSAQRGTSLPLAYATESAGGVIGGAASTLFLAWGMQNFAASAACGLACIAAPVLYPRLGTSLRLAGAVAGAVLILAIAASNPIEERATAWNHPGLVVSRDTPYGRVTVTALADQITVFENDALAFETQGREIETFCHLPALQHAGPNIPNILLLGGIEGMGRELLKHNPQRVDWVELNRAEVGLVVPRLPADMRDWMRDGRVHLRFADPRRFLEEAGAYDLVMVGMPEPLSGQANRFYTREFFAACASRMRPGGILALRLQNGENFWTPAMKGRVESIYAALRSVFPEVVFLPGDSNVVTASSAPLPTDPEVLIGRLRSRGIRTTLVRPPYIRYLYSNDRYSEIRRMLKNAGAPPNTDLRPVCYRYTVVIWLSKFFPSLASGGPPARSAISTRSAGPWVAGGALAVLFCVARRRGRLRRIMLAGVAGFAGMALESVLILYYQVKQGILYQDIGLLLMSFMAGLALGAFATEKAITAGGGTRRVKSFAIGLLVGFSLLCGLVSLQLAASGAEAGLARTILLLVSSGFAVAGIFTCASRYDTGLPSLADRNGWEEEARATGKGERWGEEGDALAPLYGADLAGGCLGALLAGLLMIPLAGLPSTTLWTALSALLALLLV